MTAFKLFSIRRLRGHVGNPVRNGLGMIKRSFLILCILAQAIGRGPWAMLDDSAMAATVGVSSYTVLAGIVKSVSRADPIKGTKSEIIVIDAEKKIAHILVTPTTTVWDPDARAILPDKIVAHSKVHVIYHTTPEGINIGKSIKILK